MEKKSSVRPCQILHFDIDLNDIKNYLKKKNATITELMLSIFFSNNIIFNIKKRTNKNTSTSKYA